MQYLENRSLALTGPEARSVIPTRREVAARIFRQRTVFLVTFLLVLVAFFITGQFSRKYKSEMKILVRKERVDPIVTTDTSSTPQLQTVAVREEDINSAVQLLRGDDLLREVAVQSGLIPPDNTNVQTSARIVRKLQRDLDITALPKTDLIAATYESPDPEQSRRVLANLASLYLAKQRNVRGRDFQLSFFAAQVQEHGKALQAAEAKLLDFTKRTGVVSAELERDLTVRQMEEMSQARMENKALVAAASARAQQLSEQMLTQPKRIATEKTESDNPALLNQLKTTLLTLQLKRTDLLNKYDPSYRLVQDVDREIATTQGMLDAQLAAPVKADTSTLNPTFMALESELVKQRAELNGLRAKGAQLNGSFATVESSAQDLAGKNVEQDALLRDVTTQKSQYQLYVEKLEQARMANSLDKDGILNVVVAQDPIAPDLPVNSTISVIAMALFTGFLLSFGAAFLADVFDSTVRTPSELGEILHVPMLAVFEPVRYLEGGEA